MGPFSPSNRPKGREPIAFARLVNLIAPALGTEKSEELLSASARNFGYSTDMLDLERALQIFVSLESNPGIVGVAARFGKSRLLSRTSQSSISIERQSIGVPPERADPVQKAATRLPPREIAKLLAATLGTEKARETLAAALAHFGMAEGPLDRTEALALLDHIAKEPGIVGDRRAVRESTRHSAVRSAGLGSKRSVRAGVRWRRRHGDLGAIRRIEDVNTPATAAALGEIEVLRHAGAVREVDLHMARAGPARADLEDAALVVRRGSVDVVEAIGGFRRRTLAR